MARTGLLAILFAVAVVAAVATHAGTRGGLSATTAGGPTECRKSVAIKSLGFDHKRASKRTFLIYLGKWRVRTYNSFRDSLDFSPIDNLPMDITKPLSLFTHGVHLHHMGNIVQLISSEGVCVSLILEKMADGVSFIPLEDRVAARKDAKSFERNPEPDYVVKSDITLEQLMCRVQETVGAKTLFSYHPTDNNCQHYVRDVGKIIAPDFKPPFPFEFDAMDKFKKEHPILAAIPVSKFFQFRNRHLISYMTERCPAILRGDDDKSEKAQAELRKLKDDGDDDGKEEEGAAKDKGLQQNNKKK